MPRMNFSKINAALIGFKGVCGTARSRPSLARPQLGKKVFQLLTLEIGHLQIDETARGHLKHTLRSVGLSATERNGCFGTAPRPVNPMCRAEAFKKMSNLQCPPLLSLLQ